MEAEEEGLPLAPPVTPRVSVEDSSAVESWEEQFEALADAVVHTPEWKAACAAEEIRAQSPYTTPERQRSQANEPREAARAIAFPIDLSETALVVETHAVAHATDKTTAAPVAKSGLEELTFVVEQLLKDDTCPWCAASTPAQMVTWLQSELTEVAEELFLASGRTNSKPTQSSCNGNGSTLMPSNPQKAMGMSAAAEPAALHSSALESEVGDVLFNVFLAAELCRRDGLQCSLDRACRAAAVKVRRRAPYAFAAVSEEGKSVGSSSPSSSSSSSSAVGDVASAEECWQNAKAAERSQKQPEQHNQASNSVAGVDDEECGELASAAVGDAVVLFAKWPIKGRAKTRLAKAPELGDEGAQQVALAMLEDALVGLATCPALEKVTSEIGKRATKAVLFAPPDAGPRFLELLDQLGLPGHLEDSSSSNSTTTSPPPPLNTVRLISMATTASAPSSGANAISVTDAAGKDLTASDLGVKLQQGLSSVRKLLTVRNDSGKDETKPACFGAVAIQGMDSPELSPTAVAQSLGTARRGGCAALRPATDGGYVLLTLPPAAPTKVFTGVEWSTPHTCYSQVSALSRVGISCRIHLPPLADMDEPSDLRDLHRRLLLNDPALSSQGNGASAHNSMDRNHDSSNHRNNNENTRSDAHISSSNGSGNCQVDELCCLRTKALLLRIYGSQAEPAVGEPAARSIFGEMHTDGVIDALPSSSSSSSSSTPSSSSSSASSPELAATSHETPALKSTLGLLLSVGIAMGATSLLMSLWPKVSARKNS